MFSTKNIGEFQILMSEILTKHYLTVSLVLNNQALTFKVSSCQLMASLVLNKQTEIALYNDFFQAFES